MSDQPNNVQASTTNRISHIFTPFIYVETDDDGSNPRIVDVEWIDSYLNSTDLATQTIINEDYTDKLPSALAASEWLDQHTPRLSALIRSVKP